MWGEKKAERIPKAGGPRARTAPLVLLWSPRRCFCVSAAFEYGLWNVQLVGEEEGFRLANYTACYNDHPRPGSLARLLLERDLMRTEEARGACDVNPPGAARCRRRRRPRCRAGEEGEENARGCTNGCVAGVARESAAEPVFNHSSCGMKVSSCQDRAFPRFPAQSVRSVQSEIQMRM